MHGLPQSGAVFEGTSSQPQFTYPTTRQDRPPARHHGRLTAGRSCTPRMHGAGQDLSTPPGCRGPGDSGVQHQRRRLHLENESQRAWGSYSACIPVRAAVEGEMAIVSWRTSYDDRVALSIPADPNNPGRRSGSIEGCLPHRRLVPLPRRTSATTSGLRRTSVGPAELDRAGGNGQFGRRDFLGHGRGDRALR